MALDREKYKALYEYQKLQFEDEKGQYFKLEDKASKYLSFLTIFITVYVFVFTNFIKNITENINFILYIIIIFCFFSSILLFCSAWSFIFRTMKLMDIPKLTSNNELIEFFLDNDLESVYWDRAEKYSEAIQLYSAANNQKIKFMNIAYNEITFGSWLFVISICLLLIIKLMHQ